jgi:hypothetical protein
MNEDISATVRLGTTVILLAALVTAIVVLVTNVMPLYYDWINKTQEALQPKSELVFDEISQQTSISGAEVYKLYSLNSEYFYITSITSIDGIVSYDCKALKTKASKKYKVNIQYNIDGNHPNQYALFIREVNY